MADAAPNRIREWREKRQMNVAQLAESVGTSSPQIARLESGERKLSPEWMERLATALKCIPAELLPSHLYKPALSPAEERLIAAYRTLDDVEQIRWQKAFLAYCAPVATGDIHLTD